ncbi:MAG TPA: PEP-CTERM sorting domain-containing protein [Roseiarcus sp.]|nr:PEP-CTERM sorting domain-containing protein [Roseiarcus sp.]
MAANGADIVGGDAPPAFNVAFSLTGSTVPEPLTWAMMLLGFAGRDFAGCRRARRAAAGSV